MGQGMSAFYSFVYGDCVQLLTDGAFLDEKGILRAIDRKVFTFPNHPIAIACRAASAARAFQTIADLCDFIDSFGFCDDADAVLMFAKEFFGRLEGNGPFDAEFLIAAYSEENGPCHFIVQCHGRWNIPAFKMVCPGMQIGGGPPVSLNDLQHLNITPSDVETSNFPERFGAELIGAMRKKATISPGSGSLFFGVGGCCDLTTVKASGAITKQLCTWDDKIGVPIDPSRDFSSSTNNSVS